MEGFIKKNYSSLKSFQELSKCRIYDSSLFVVIVEAATMKTKWVRVYIYD